MVTKRTLRAPSRWNPKALPPSGRRRRGGRSPGAPAQENCRVSPQGDTRRGPKGPDGDGVRGGDREVPAAGSGQECMSHGCKYGELESRRGVL